MRNYNIGIFVLSLVVLTFLILGFMEGGNPFALRAQALDAERLRDMNMIRGSVEDYFRTHQELPENLEQLSLNRELYFDPTKSKNRYDYEIVSNNISYKLCTEFSTDTTKGQESRNLSNYIIDYDIKSSAHKKGYDCITYTLPTYIFAKPSPSVRPTITQPTPTKSSEFKKSFTAKFERLEGPSYNPKLIVLENSQTKIVTLLNDTVILDKDNNFIKTDDLKQGDSLLIYASAIKGSDEYTAARIHDFSR